MVRRAAMRLRPVFFGAFGLMILFGVAGCQAPEGMGKLAVTEDKELVNKWPMPKKVFLAHETPVVRVKGCEGHRFTIRIVNAASGEVAAQRDGLFPNHIIETEDPRLTVARPYNSSHDPVVPIYQPRINIYGKYFLLRPANLPAGNYEAQLLIEDKLAEKTAFTVSN